MTYRMTPGSPLPNPFPGGTWNRFGDLVDMLERSEPYDDATRNQIMQLFAEAIVDAQGHYTPIQVENETGADLVEFSVVKLKQPSFDYPAAPIDVADDSLLQRQVVRVESATPDDTQLLITVDLIANTGSGMAAAVGIVPARVDIQAESDKTCAAIDGDSTKLLGGSGPVQIWWKPSGTGVRWCLVQLGGSSPTPTEFTGLATAAVTSGTSTFNVDNIVLINGTDPRTDPSSSTETVQVKNTFGLDADDNAKFWVRENQAGDYEALRPGEGGGTTELYCELTADLDLSATTGTAQLLNDDGTPASPLSVITVQDPLQKWQGLATYTDPEDNVQRGFFLRVTPYDDSGVTKYRIVWMESHFPLILVELNESVETGTGPFETDYLQGHGSNGAAKPPPRSATGVMLTYNARHLADGALNPSTWLAGYDAATKRYELLAPDWVDGARARDDYDDSGPLQALVQEAGVVKWINTIVCNVSP